MGLPSKWVLIPCRPQKIALRQTINVYNQSSTLKELYWSLKSHSSQTKKLSLNANRKTQHPEIPAESKVPTSTQTMFIIFFSRVDFLCWLLFQYPFHPCGTAVACKRSRSFFQKCRWQVTAKHAYTSRMWLCMKWHGAWLYGVHRTCAEKAAVSCGPSYASAVSTPLRWIFKKGAIKS